MNVILPSLCHVTGEHCGPTWWGFELQPQGCISAISLSKLHPPSRPVFPEYAHSCVLPLLLNARSTCDPSDIRVMWDTGITEHATAKFSFWTNALCHHVYASVLAWVRRRWGNGPSLHSLVCFGISLHDWRFLFLKSIPLEYLDFRSFLTILSTHHLPSPGPAYVGPWCNS